MHAIRKTIILFNPNSTGDSEANARQLAKELSDIDASRHVTIQATQHKGHAAEIASEHASDDQTLIVSSSGDGGYNEVINGVLRTGGKALTAVLPSGNANDHHSTLGTDNLAKHIIEGKAQSIDVLKISARVNGKKWERYAHSYIGFGVTPKVGHELTERRPNVVTEKWYALRHLLSFRYTPIEVDGQKKKYSNLLFATIPRMSKVIKLHEDASVHDGLMEMYVTGYASPIELLKYLFVASTKGISHEEQLATFSFRTIRASLVQLDGEVFKLDADCAITVTCKKAALRTIL